MAANFGFVADAAERQAHELASERARNRLAQRSLAGARRSDEAKDRTLGVVLELAHREKLEDAFLYFFEVVMILVEHLARVTNVEIVFGRDAPRQADEPVEVGAHDGMLGRLGRNHLEALEFLVGDFARLGRHLRLFDLLLDFFDFGTARVALAEFLLNRLKLLAQVILALIFVELGLHLRLDFMPEFEHLDLAAQNRDQLFQPSAHVERRQQILRLFDWNLQVRGDHVGQAAGFLHLHRHHLQFVGQVRHERNEFGELADQVRVQRVDFLVGGHRLDQPLHVREKIRLALGELPELDSRQTLYQHAHALIRVAQHLEDAYGGAAREQSFGGRLLVFRIFLRGERNHLVGLAAFIYQLERRRPRNQERMYLTWKNYNAAQRQHRQNFGNLGLAEVLFNLEAFFPFGLICHRSSNLVGRTPRAFHATQISP